MSPNDPNTLDHERRLARLEAARHEMGETLVVIGEIERRQSAVLREHSERVVEHERWYARMQRMMTGLTEKIAEIGENLDGLIGWADGTIQRNKPPDQDKAPQH